MTSTFRAAISQALIVVWLSRRRPNNGITPNTQTGPATGTGTETETETEAEAQAVARDCHFVALSHCRIVVRLLLFHYYCYYYCNLATTNCQLALQPSGPNHVDSVSFHIVLFSHSYTELSARLRAPSAPPPLRLQCAICSAHWLTSRASASCLAWLSFLFYLFLLARSPSLWAFFLLIFCMAYFIINCEIIHSHMQNARQS